MSGGGVNAAVPSNLRYLPVAVEPGKGPEPYLGKKGLAQFFGCGVRTIEHWIAAGAPVLVCAGKRVGRASEVEAWAKRTGRLHEEAA